MEITREAIEDAAGRIGELIRHTPVLEVEPGFFLKLDLVQATGSFKVRGAFSFLTAHPEADHVVAASGGNHGLAVAYAASRLGRKADIFCPAASPSVKVDRIRATGASLHLVDGPYAAALEASRRLLSQDPDAVEVHAYDDPAVVAGQGTCGREMAAQVPDVEEVVVAVGGGGLIGGIASWIREDATVVAAETHCTPTLHHSLEAGERVEVQVGGVSADSLGAAQVGEIGFAAARRWVEAAVLVGDDDVRSAQRWLWDECRLVAEPGAATAVAAALSRRQAGQAGSPVCVVVSGGNAHPHFLQ